MHPAQLAMTAGFDEEKQKVFLLFFIKISGAFHQINFKVW
jgi:hypothetical protein